MKKLVYLLAAGAMALSPAITFAGPGGHGGGMGRGGGATMGQGATMGRAGGMGPGNAMGTGNMGGLSATGGMSLSGPASTHTSQGSTNGAGWDHLNSPHHETGQPGVECEDGVPPGNASSARGSAFNEDGVSHGKYAGEQPQNSRNTASSSQYDTACLRPQH